MCWKFECRYDIHYKTQYRDQLRKMQLQGLPAGNRIPATSGPATFGPAGNRTRDRGNPEVAGSIPSRKALELHFSQLVPVWVL